MVKHSTTSPLVNTHVRTLVDICGSLWKCAFMQDMSINRIRKPTNVTLEPELIEALDAWIARQPLRVARSVVIEEAIRQFLAWQEKRK